MTARMIWKDMVGDRGIFVVRMMFLLATVFIILRSAPDVEAATTLKQLNANTTYKSYDFNRDGKKDTFKYTFSNPRGYAIITLNGKKSKVSTVRGAGLYYYRYSRDNEFLLVNYSFFGGSDVDVYRFNRNAAVRVQTLPETAFTSNCLKSASGNMLYVETYPHRSAHFPTAANSACSMRFRQVYRLDTGKHKFVLGSRYLKSLRPNWLCFISASSSADYCTSSSPTAYNRKGVRLTSYQYYTVKQIYLLKKNSRTTVKRVQVANENGRTGWFDDSSRRLFY